jgi:hypothetical protein
MPIFKICKEYGRKRVRIGKMGNVCAALRVKRSRKNGKEKRVRKKNFKKMKKMLDISKSVW